MLPDENERVKKDGKFGDAGGVSSGSGSEDGIQVGGNNFDDNFADFHGPAAAADLLPVPPAGYQLLSPNSNTPAQHMNDDDDDDDSASSHSTVTSNNDQPPPINGHGANSSIQHDEEPDYSEAPTFPDYDDGRDPEASNFARHMREEVVGIWSSQPSNANSSQSESAEDPSLQPDQRDRILQSMSSFTLPAENIPSWAEQIPEGQWKDVLLDRLKKINKQN